jgi:hypothetical protein
LLTVEDQLACLACVRRHLARAGFALEHLYAGADKSEYGSRYPGELFFVASSCQAK